MDRKRLSIVSLPLLLSAMTAAQATDLSVRVEGIDVARGGSLQLAIYRDAKAFESYERSVVFATVTRALDAPSAETGLVSYSISLSGVPEGKYAIHHYHDANNNRRFDSDGNKPLEGWGMSRARHMWQSPSFKRAAFTVAGSSTNVVLKTFYVE